MNDMVISMIVIACTAIAVGLIFYLVSEKKKKTLKALSDLANQKGWKFSPFKETLSWGFRIFTPEWMLESITETTDNSAEISQNNASQHTRLKSTGYKSKKQYLINPRSSMSTPLAGVQPAMLHKLSGIFGSIELADLQEMTIGSSQLREKYVIYGKSAVNQTVAISQTVENILLNWKGERPWIRISSDGLEIEIRNKNIQTPEEIENIANLTDSLLVSLRESNI